MRMPWGKHKGWSIDDLPDGYVLWALYQSNIHDDDLLDALKEEVLSRWPDRAPVKYYRMNMGSSCQQVSIPERAKKAYREVAIMFHPDKGGDVEAMKAINVFYDMLRAA